MAQDEREALRHYINNFSRKFVQAILACRQEHFQARPCLLPNRPGRTGKSWFMLNIQDIDTGGRGSVKPPQVGKPLWLEFAVKTDDQEEMSLEVWIVALKPRPKNEMVIDHIFTIDNNMSRILRSSMVISRVLPACAMIRRGQLGDSYRIIHRHACSPLQLEGLGGKQKFNRIGVLPTSIGDLIVSVAWRGADDYILNSARSTPIPAAVPPAAASGFESEPCAAHEATAAAAAAAVGEPLKTKSRGQSSSSPFKIEFLPSLPPAPVVESSGLDSIDGEGAESFTVRHFGVNAQGMKDGEIDELTSFLEKWAVSPAIVPESPEVEPPPSTARLPLSNHIAAQPPWSDPLHDTAAELAAHAAHSAGATALLDTSFECDSDLDEAAAADSGMNEHHVECGRVYSMAMKLQADATLNSAVTSMFPDEPIGSLLSDQLARANRADSLIGFFNTVLTPEAIGSE